MSVHAALARPVPRPAWHRVAAWAVFAALALIIAGMVWAPAALAVLLPLGAGVAKLRAASRTVDTIFAEELITRERISENGDRVEIS
ncbi:hypothetical protein [Amycolatopsis sp. SID8362]|uniref:hypothetical protein n=1 Tax=Amycolatopsis sp. SID8362 TaxID=2690346 RepID=UPI00136AF40F|nr:hypothetical protein [Amycolatopsis sp. SID8362]NBH03034.1 hypothetical protein [Amycolatopsis sp. SID8362]NED39735.1 hypothetical protein [Amycolatopsis sp. SID8362]